MCAQLRFGNLIPIVSSFIRRYGGSLFGLTSRHQVLVNLPDVDRFLSQSYHTLSSEPVQYTLMTRICGARDSPELKRKSESSWKDLLEPIERLFLNDAAAAAAIERGGVIERAASFVTFSADAKHMKRWELSAGIRVVGPDLPNRPGVVEANLHSLTRDFGACLAIPLLYGQDFLDRYSQVLDDFWKFDGGIFPLLMMGIPPWAPLKVMKRGLAARSRLVNELEALYRRIDQHQRGEPVDFGADMSDVSHVALERNKVYDRENWTFQQRGEGDLAVLWGQNANTQPMLFWFLAFVFSTAGLLPKLREEIAPYVKLSQTSPLEILSMDLVGLCHDCPLMKACVFETYRMANEPASVRFVTRPITISDGAYNHKLKAGTFVTAAHSLIQRNPSVYTNPDKFVPNRFLNPDPESGKLSPRYGALKPWGSGPAACKGRTFAEKEIIALGASVISLWDIGPASGMWDLPAMVPGMGAKKPVEDVRVVISRRILI